MPSRCGTFIGVEHFLGRRMERAAWKWVEASSSLALEQYFPQLPVLDKKDIRAKFKENIVVRGNTMNRSKVFRGLRDMENIMYYKITMWSMNNRLTNVLNAHTCTVGRVYLVIAIVRVPGDQFIKLSCHMIRGP
jgi:hypothetical protein